MPFAHYKSSAAPSQPYDVNTVNRQIDNATKRIQDAGFTPQDADTRNWFEKLTNLPEHQNAFLDTLELLGRPGQGIMNIIDKVPTGQENAGQAFLRGVTGQERIHGADIVEHRGINDPLTKAILGTGVEIATDPLNLIPAGLLAKGVKVAAIPAARGFARFAKAIEPAAVRSLRETTIQPALSQAKDAIGRALIPDYKLNETLFGTPDETIKNLKQQTENNIGFQTEEALRNVADTAKLAGGIDTGQQVGRLLEAPLKQFENVPAYQLPSGGITENKKDIYGAISGNRGQIKGLGKELNQTKRGYQSAIGEFANSLNKTDSEIRKVYFQLERSAGKEIDKQTRQNLRDSSRELARLESQLNNFGQNENSLLRSFKKQIRDNHESMFDLAKQIRRVAPDGIKGVLREELPPTLRNIVRSTGKGIDEVANELGYQRADDLLKQLDAVKNLPRKLDNAAVEQLARKEMERTGALKDLEDRKNQIIMARDAIKKSVNEFKKSDATQAAFAELAKNPRYQELSQQRDTLKSQLDSLKGESKQARQAKIDQIKALENEIGNLKTAVQNPITIQKELPRPQRDLSQDPKIQQAAETLLRSNQAVRQMALENGVDVKELEGYMTHVLSQEERKRRNNLVAIDRGNRGIGQPKKAILNPRKLTGSVEDINDKVGRNFFEPNAFFASAVGQKRLIEYANAVNFRRQVLSNPNFAIPYEKGMDIPKNAVVIDTNHYTFLKDPGENLPTDIGGQYLVTKSVKTALDRYQKLTTDEGINGFLKAFDKLQSGWKRLALFSVPFHLRNDIGAKFNNWVGGMPLHDLAKYSAEADIEVYNAIIKGKESPMYLEYRKQGLSSSSLSGIEYARGGVEPEEAIQKTIEKRSQYDGTLKGRLKAEAKQLKNPLNAFQTSQEFGAFIDQTNRFTLYKWARDNGKSPEDAAKLVRTVQFDYSQTTPFEREVLVRLVPFYRWMKNNIPFQIRAFINDPKKYANINKLRLNAQSSAGINDQNVPDWMKESFAFPVIGQGGKGQFLGLNLPLTDLTKLSQPLKTAIDSVTPIAKIPAEVEQNRNFFFQSPIKRFAGQEKQFQVPFGGPKFGVDQTLAYILEQLGGQVGRGVSGFLQQPQNQDQQLQFLKPALGISSLLKPYDAQKSEYFQQRDRLQQLQDLLNYIEQQTGQRPRTIQEIQRSG